MVNVQSIVDIGVGWVPSTAYVQAKEAACISSQDSKLDIYLEQHPTTLLLRSSS
jgi:hypothetical protein